MSERLTKTQKRILLLIHENGVAEFGRGTRKFNARVFHARIKDGKHDWKIIIHAYQMPEYFLHRRGLIEAEGRLHHYRLSKKGTAAVNDLKASGEKSGAA